MIIISKAKVTDSENIRKLEKNVWKEEVVNKYDMPMFIRFGYVYVAKDNDKIVGVICAFKTRNNEIFVSDWVVNKKYRKNKIGLKLYAKLIMSTKLPLVTFLDPELIPTIIAHKKLGFKFVKKVKKAYGNVKGLEYGTRLLMRLDRNE